MTCKQLSGACDKAFHAETFEEIGDLCKNHAMELASAGDRAHIDKMDEMKKNFVENPEAVQEWFKKVRAEFDALPEDR